MLAILPFTGMGIHFLHQFEIHEAGDHSPESAQSPPQHQRSAGEKLHTISINHIVLTLDGRDPCLPKTNPSFYPLNCLLLLSHSPLASSRPRPRRPLCSSLRCTSFACLRRHLFPRSSQIVPALAFAISDVICAVVKLDTTLFLLLGIQLLLEQDAELIA